MITTIFYILAITTTLSIYLKTKKISTLSNHQGIKLTNQAFLFFALAYIIQFLTSSTSLPISKLSILQALTQPVQIYLFTIAALYLSTSIFWKNSQHDKTPLHMIALLVTILSNFTNVLTLTLITIYAYTTIKSYINYQTKKTNFSEFYLIAIVLLLTSNTLNLLNFSLLTSQAMTTTAFTIFLYGTLKTIKN